jgi:hypothetical protein
MKEEQLEFSFISEMRVDEIIRNIQYLWSKIGPVIPPLSELFCFDKYEYNSNSPSIPMEFICSK